MMHGQANIISKSSFFWVVAQRRLVPTGVSGQRSHHPVSRRHLPNLQLGPTHCLEKPVKNQSAPRNNPEKRRPRPLRVQSRLTRTFLFEEVINVTRTTRSKPCTGNFSGVHRAENLCGSESPCCMLVGQRSLHRRERNGAVRAGSERSETNFSVGGT